MFKTITTLINGNNTAKKEEIITYWILYPILPFAVLIFNEVLILKVCTLHYNTKKYIRERERDDINEARESVISDLLFDDEAELSINTKWKIRIN